MLNIILLILIFAAIGFIALKFLIANKKEKVSAIVMAGANAGLQPLLAYFETSVNKEHLLPGWEYATRYFFQALGLTQYQSISKQLNQKTLTPQALEQVNQNVINLVQSHTPPTQGQSAANITSEIFAIAKQLSPDTQNLDAPACALPQTASIAAELAPYLFKAENISAEQENFQTAMNDAIQKSNQQIWQTLSGNTSTERHMGGGCC